MKEIAEKVNLKERVVRPYIWRMKKREKCKAFVKRWCEKKQKCRGARVAWKII